MKHWMKKHWIVTSVFFVACVAMAAKITENNLKIGQPGSSADKVIEFDVGDGANNPTIVVDNTDKDFDFNKAMNIAGDLLKVGDGSNSTKEVVFDIGSGANNPRFRWNSVNNILEFANDGTSFKKIGSGSGGASGVNVLSESNFDFELGTPPDSWTASGGTFTAETTSPLFGDASGSWDSNALDQTLDSVLGSITSGFLGRTCQAAIEYKYAAGSAGDYQLIARQFDDSGATEIDVAVLDLEVTGTTSQPAVLFFTCPDDAADTLRVRIQSKVADAGVILVDDAFIGTGRASQFGVPSNEIITNFLPADVSITGTIASLTFSGLEIGKTYELSGQFYFGLDISAPDPGVEVQAVHDGNIVARSVVVIQETSDSSTDNIMIPMTAKFVATTTSLTFTTPDASTNSRVLGNGTGSGSFVQLEKRNDLGAPSESITLETSGEYWNVQISGGVIDLSSGDVASYTEITDPDLQIIPNPGSATAKIPCSATNPATGTTCAAGDESVGIVIDVKSAGLYQVCGQFNHRHDVNGPSGSGETTFEWQHTANASQSILQDGGAKWFNMMITGSSLSGRIFDAKGFQLCSYFRFSPGEQTLRLMYEQNTGGTTYNQSQMYADADPATGQRDFNIVVRKMDQQFPTPVFTDLQNSLNAKIGSGISGTKRFTAELNCDASSTIIDNPGSWVDSITNISGSACLINFASAGFSVAPRCFATRSSSHGLGTSLALTAATTTGLTFDCLISDGAAACSAIDFYLSCEGE